MYPRRDIPLDILVGVFIGLAMVMTFYHLIALFFVIGLTLILIIARESTLFKSIGIIITAIFMLFLLFESMLFPAYYIPPDVFDLFGVLRGMNYFVISAFIITIIFVGVIISAGVTLGIAQKRFLNQWIVICLLLLVFAVFDALWFPFLLSDPNVALAIFVFHTAIYFVCFTITFFIIYVTALFVTKALKSLYYQKSKFVAEV